MKDFKYQIIYSKKNASLYFVDKEENKIMWGLPCHSYKQYVFYVSKLKDWSNGLEYEKKGA